VNENRPNGWQIGARRPWVVALRVCSLSFVAVGVLAGLTAFLTWAGFAGVSARAATNQRSVDRWKPTTTDRWIYQISDPDPAVKICIEPVERGPCVRPTVWVLDLYAEDGASPNADAVKLIHSVGGRAVCYVSAGSWEDWRPDAKRFARQVLGRELAGWPGERWLNVRERTTLLPLMRDRAKRCRQAGFDAIDWDNVDGYANKTGFRISAKDQRTYNLALAKIAHELGLSVGLKNDLGQVAVLEPRFDFAVNESCATFNECRLLAPFEKAGKPIVAIEYNATSLDFCRRVGLRWSAMLMDRELTVRSWKPCR
jgi:endo-alpha-1,4-polygalactosaminidase (GH114 family)